MVTNKYAKIAVSNVIPSIDKPYEYLVPETLAASAAVGKRVTVPFGKGGKREGIILSISDTAENIEHKAITGVVDAAPVLSEQLIKLALWMRDRFFCTVYDAVRVMLPSGLWLKDGAQRIRDKTVLVASLNVSGEDALAFAAENRRSAKAQAAVMELMASVGSAAIAEITYFTGHGRAVINALVSKGLLVLSEEEILRRPEIGEITEAEELVLSSSQRAVKDGLSEMLSDGTAGAALVYGVTGSGKTSVYISLIKDVVKAGRSAIVLVPEISLTPQLVRIFASHFGDSIAILHSSLGIGERYDEWKRIKSGAAQVVVGTRSAVFAPVSDLGLIVIDEEQEYTYKSEQTPRYHARDVAKFRCVQSNALLVFGSATPSVASMYNAELGKYKLFTLNQRYNGHELPPVSIADMKDELRSGNGSTISRVLYNELYANIQRGEQSILFINRRGASNLVVCGECGYTFSCPRCSVSQTYHSVSRRLMCHYCGASRSVPEKCPECGGKLKFVGAGTQKVEQDIRELFPDAPIIRMDTDTVAPMHSHEKLLDSFKNDKIPILIGTQMVTKGLDFDNVTLVGVISADQSLYVNDYRAHERTFSLIAQVIGRCGRGEKRGRAVIQTFTPSNEVIRLAAAQDYTGFYKRDIELRSHMQLPPYTEIFSISLVSQNEVQVLKCGRVLADAFNAYLKKETECKVLGPAPASVSKINNKYRYKITICCDNNRRVRDIISFVLKKYAGGKEFRGVTVSADIDPLD